MIKMIDIIYVFVYKTKTSVRNITVGLTNTPIQALSVENEEEKTHLTIYCNNMLMEKGEYSLINV